jgi:myo-inositol 2-dehydrogenase/D-chiro-inositol 1-dehydrogenase
MARLPDRSDVRTALVFGAGRMGRLRVAQLMAHEAVDACVVATADTARAADLAGDGVRVVDVATVGDLRPDLAVVASATARHEEDLGRALALGCPLLCDKPLTSDSASGRELAARAAAAGTPLFVAFQLHHVASVRALRERIAAGELGVLYHLRFTHMDRHVREREFIASSGGLFKDMLVHDVECASWLTRRRVASVYASAAVRGWPVFAEYGDFDTATVVLTMDDGLTVTLNGTRHNPLGQDMRIEAAGSRDAVAAGLTAATPLVALDAPGLLGNDPAQGFEQAFGEAVPRETRAFVDFALGRADAFDGTTPEAAVEAVRVAEACERSNAEGRVVRLGEPA